MRNINVVNKSTVVTTPEFTRAAQAMQFAVSRLLGPRWGLDATLYHFLEAPDGEECVILLDDSDQADALGYHTLLAQSLVPVGFAFAKTAKESGVAWEEVLSHELFEQLVNPYLLNCAIAPWNGSLAALAIEVCDPVEREGVVVSGVRISSFVFPSWFMPTTPAGSPFDQMGSCKAPLTLLPGGYQSYSHRLGVWDQSCAAEAHVSQYRRFIKHSVYSRPSRRARLLAQL